MSERPTRRDVIKYGGIAGGAGMLAGCAGTTEQTPEPGDDATETPTATETSTPTEDPSYTVELSPVGEVTFEEGPSNVMAYSPQYVDMLAAFGHADSLNSMGFLSYADTMNYFFEHLDGVDVPPKEGLTQLFSNGSFDKELLYELDSDVHLMDPAWLSNFDGWSKADTEEISDNVAPFFANRYSREHTQPPKGWRDGYRYYTIWELSGKVAQVLQEEERFAALREEYEKLYGRVRSNLPPKAERPTVGLIAFYEGEFYPYKISGPGFGKAHTRPMGAVDAFADSDRTYDENYGSSYDFEGMLETDPDVILHNFAVTPFYDWDTVTEKITTNDVGKELTAVENDRLYPSGQSFQGPITNLLQIEMTAKQLYPEQFGEWPEYQSGDTYPEFDEDEQLFDHERVAAIARGEF
jgi:ABC-type Fe3+-hydroxamate transport system substrate-binding protein